jgi:rubrerythrin
MSDTDDDLLELLLIPKVGKARAKILHAAGFRTCNDLARADPEDIANLPGISPELARSIVDYALHAASVSVSDQLEVSTELLVCPMCGSMVSGAAKECPNCGIAFSDEVDEPESASAAGLAEGDADGHWYKEQDKLFICPECGSLVSAKSDRCPKCGVMFEGEEDGGDAPPGQPPKGEADGYWYKEESGIFMCPNCGAFISKTATGCGSCGIVFEADDGEAAVEEGPDTCPMCKAELPAGNVTCPACGFDASLEKDVDGHWYKDRAEIFMCPACGAFMSAGANSCPNCGVVLEGEEEPEPESGAAACPNCGAPVGEGGAACLECGFDFTADKRDGFWYREEDSIALFMCPACGAFISETAGRCTNCGVGFNEQGEAVQDGQREEHDEEVDELMALVLEEGAGEAEPAEPAAPADAVEHERPVALCVCPVCGAFIEENLVKCPVCSAVFDDLGDLELEPVEALPLESPEELARQMTADVGEIERLLEPEPGARGGVSKDFLDRWKKLGAGERQMHVPDTGAGKRAERDLDLESELEALLVEDEGPTLIDRAMDLASRGRVVEAVACLEEAAREDPARETECKRLVLEMLGPGPARALKGAEAESAAREE